MHPEESRARDKPDERLTTAGKTLKRLFRQDDSLKKIDAQPATFSLLMNPLRMHIFLHICNNPCDHLRSIARHTGSSPTVVKWHLDKLSANGFIGSETLKGKRFYWPLGMDFADDIHILLEMREAGSVKIMDAVIGNETGIGEKEICREIKESQQYVNGYLKRLVSAGMLEKNGKGKGAKYRIAPGLSRRIEKYHTGTKEFSAHLFNVMKADGLMPARMRIRGSRFHVTVRLPQGTKRITVECNPLAMLRSRNVKL